MQVILMLKEYENIQRLVEVSKKFIRAEGVRGSDDILYLDMEEAICDVAEIWGDDKPFQSEVV